MYRAAQDWMELNQTGCDLLKFLRAVRKPDIHTFFSHVTLGHVCLYVFLPLKTSPILLFLVYI